MQTVLADDVVNGVTCMQRLSELTKACTSATTEAISSCDDSQNSGLAQAQQVAVTLGQQVSTSVTAACSTLGKIAQGANAATAAFQLSCQNSVGTCSSACQNAIQYYTDTKGCSAQNGGVEAGSLSSIQDQKKSCSALNAKAATAQQALQNFLQTTLQAQNCATSTDGTSTVADLCTTNPSLAGCSTAVVDCTSAEMATNKVCICQKNPNDPTCLSGLSTTAVTSVDGTTLASRTSSGADSIDGDLYGLPEVQQAAVNPAGAGDVVDGKQGASANISSDSAGASAATAIGKTVGNAKGDAEPTQVTAGFYSGGGGSSSSGGGSTEANNRIQEEGTLSKLAQKAAGAVPDLRQFLPGEVMDPQRGVAGASGPDGITGPNTDIWKKIQNRYRVVQPTLMP